MMSVVSDDVGDVLADQRDAVEVALAVVGAAHRLEDAGGAGLQRQVDVLAYARSSACARITSSRMSFGWGLV